MHSTEAPFVIASNEQGVLQVGLSVAGEGVVQGDGLAAVLRFGLAPVADKGARPRRSRDH